MQQAIVTEQAPAAEKALVYTTRFGEVTLHEDRLISFPKGILGFSDCTTFGLSRLPNSEDSPIMLLQCVNEPEIGFLVAEPSILGLSIAAEDLSAAVTELKMDSETTQTLVILTLYNKGEGDFYLTANLRAPLFVDSTTREARQHILANKDYTTQHKL